MENQKSIIELLQECGAKNITTNGKEITFYLGEGESPRNERGLYIKKHRCVFEEMSHTAVHIIDNALREDQPHLKNVSPRDSREFLKKNKELNIEIKQGISEMLIEYYERATSERKMIIKNVISFEIVVMDKMIVTAQKYYPWAKNYLKETIRDMINDDGYKIMPKNMRKNIKIKGAIQIGENIISKLGTVVKVKERQNNMGKIINKSIHSITQTPGNKYLIQHHLGGTNVEMGILEVSRMLKDKSIIEQMHTVTLKWREQDIERAYTRDNFINGQDIASCMWNKGSDVAEFYSNYDAGVAILSNQYGEWLGRCIIWKFQDKVLYDRLYTSKQYMSIFEYLLKKNNCIPVNRYGTVIDGERKHVSMKSKTYYEEYGFVPYLDSLRYMDDDGNLCTTDYLKNRSYPYICDSTSGDDPRPHNYFYDVDGNRIHHNERDDYVEIEGDLYHMEDERIGYCDVSEEYCLQDNLIRSHNGEWFDSGRYDYVELENGEYARTSGPRCDMVVKAEGEYYLIDDERLIFVDGDYYNIENGNVVEADGDYYHIESPDIVNIDGIYYLKTSNQVVEIDGQYYLKSKI